MYTEEVAHVLAARATSTARSSAGDRRGDDGDAAARPRLDGPLDAAPRSRSRRRCSSPRLARRSCGRPSSSAATAVEWPLLVSFVFWLDRHAAQFSAAIFGAQFSARNSAHLSDGAPPPPQGFYSLADIAGEVDNPRRVFPLTVAVLEPTNALVNLLPLAVALSIDPNPRHYEVSYFSTRRQLAGGCEGRRAAAAGSATSSSSRRWSRTSATTTRRWSPPRSSSASSWVATPRRQGGRRRRRRRQGGGRRLPAAPFFGTCSRGRRRRQPGGDRLQRVLHRGLIVLFPLDVLIELVAFIMTINMSSSCSPSCSSAAEPDAAPSGCRAAGRARSSPPPSRSPSSPSIC